MTDYKLVPYDPAPEMVEAAKDAYMPFGDMDLAIRMAILAAPAVQGEAVGYIRRSALELMKNDELGVRANIIKEPRYRDCVALYTAPQPAEQQPDDSAAVRMDKQRRQDVAAALGFIRGGNYAWSYLLQQIKDAVSVAEQQPDITRLIEWDALRAECEKLRKDAERYRGIVAAVLREHPHRNGRRGNAPGHGHSIPGIWDEDNGALAGKECAWCKTWNDALDAMQENNP